MATDLDPRTAHVSYTYEDHGDGCIGRDYYWFSPIGGAPAVSDEDFRVEHQEFTDAEWNRLFHEAFERGEDVFIREHRLHLERQGIDVRSEPVRGVLALGRLFGPTPY